MSLRDAWEAQAENWARWARKPGHDSYWRFHRDPFLSLLPPPGRLTVDIGCGEGRLSRDLKPRGYRVSAIDASPTLVRLAQEADPAGDYRVADAAALPFGDATADVAIAFMSLQDIDDMDAAVREAARILEPGGRFCIAVVHPINSAHVIERERPDAPFVLAHDYFERRRTVDTIERDGLTMTFVSRHRTFEDYFRTIGEAGFLVEAVREIRDPEHQRWRRYPLFLHVRAVKP